MPVSSTIPTPPGQTLATAIAKVLTEFVEQTVAEEAKAAGERVEKRVRGEAGRIAALCESRYSVQFLGGELIIRVDFQGLDPKDRNL